MQDQDKSKAQLLEKLSNLRQEVAELELTVTQHEAVEERLQRLATFPEQNPNLVIETDLEGNVTYVNPVAQHRFPNLQTTGRDHAILQDLPTIIAAFKNGEQDYVAREVDLGTAVYEQKICYTMANDVIGIRVFAHDITARKRAEVAIQTLAKQVVWAQEEERQRVSRELHDEAGQALIALKISLELMQADLPADNQALLQNFSEAIALTDATRDQIRLLAHGLRPPALDTVGLNLTLEDFCRDFARRTQLIIDYQGIQLSPLPDVATITLYRFLQEALTNVAKHAQATEVKVDLTGDEEVLQLSIEDNGHGFFVATSPSHSKQLTGIGILGMQERLELLGGYLELHTAVGQGTRVVATIPVALTAQESRE